MAGKALFIKTHERNFNHIRDAGMVEKFHHLFLAPYGTSP